MLQFSTLYGDVKSGYGVQKHQKLCVHFVLFVFVAAVRYRLSRRCPPGWSGPGHGPLVGDRGL